MHIYSEIDRRRSISRWHGSLSPVVVRIRRPVLSAFAAGSVRLPSPPLNRQPPRHHTIRRAWHNHWNCSMQMMRGVDVLRRKEGQWVRRKAINREGERERGSAWGGGSQWMEAGWITALMRWSRRRACVCRMRELRSFWFRGGRQENWFGLMTRESQYVGDLASPTPSPVQPNQVDISIYSVSSGCFFFGLLFWYMHIKVCLMHTG